MFRLLASPERPKRQPVKVATKRKLANDPTTAAEPDEDTTGAGHNTRNSKRMKTQA